MVGEVVGGVGVAEVSVGVGDAFFEVVGVVAGSEEVAVVVGFDDEVVGLIDVVGGGFRDVSHVGGEDEDLVFVAYAVAYAIGGVVGDGEGGDGEGSDGCGVGGVDDATVGVLGVVGCVVVFEAFVGGLGGIDGDGVSFGEVSSGSGVIGVFVGEEEGVYAVEVEAFFAESFLYGAAGDACIEEDAELSEAYVVTVAAAARG